MKNLNTWIASGLLCAGIALSSVQPVVAADEPKPEAGSQAVQPVVAADEPKPEAGSQDAASAAPSATLELASEEMRLIMGGTKGKGVLHYNGADYPFTFKTSSAGVGYKMVTAVSATGEVHGLKQIEDFAGQYTAESTTAQVGSSEHAVTYKSDKGVTLNLKGTKKGAGLSFGMGIATIELVKQ